MVVGRKQICLRRKWSLSPPEQPEKGMITRRIPTVANHVIRSPGDGSRGRYEITALSISEHRMEERLKTGYLP